MRKILITGANGFLGKSLCSTLSKTYSIRGVVRKLDSSGPFNKIEYFQGDFSIPFDWSSALSGISEIIHCAAHVHIFNGGKNDPVNPFMSINVDGTMRLARQASMAGVKRFIFISTIGVNGSETISKPFNADDIVRPLTPYAISKYLAEIKLRELSKETGMEVVIIRPPLIYGINAPGNFSKLFSLLKSGYPLPFGGLNKNLRSFIYIDNLIDLIERCIHYPAAANETFLVSDDEDVSTTKFIQLINMTLSKKAVLLRCPSFLVKLGLRLSGKKNLISSFCSSMQVDILKTKTLLRWRPSISMEEGFRYISQGQNDKSDDK